MRTPVLVFIGLVSAGVPTYLLYVSLNMLFFVPLTVGLACVVAGCIRIPEARKRSATALGSFLCLAAAVGPFALDAYERRSGKSIKVVLPSGFRGKFSIVKDRTKGRDLKLQNDVWVFEIPACGVLMVNDDSPFYRWHKETYVFADGHAAEVESLGSVAGSIQTGPGSSKGSMDYDGTTHRWRVMDDSRP